MSNTDTAAVMKRLRDMRLRTVRDHPFFGRLLMKLTLGLAGCETAFTDMRHIVFDPDFAAKLSDSELCFVMLHEVYHCVLKHCTRGRGLIPPLYNIACDIVVNSCILETMGLKEFKVCGYPAMHITPKGDEGRLHTAEEVYYMLLHEGKKKPCTNAGMQNGDPGYGSGSHSVGESSASKGNSAAHNGNNSASNGNNSANNGNNSANRGNSSASNGNNSASNGNSTANNGNSSASNGKPNGKTLSSDPNAPADGAFDTHLPWEGIDTTVIEAEWDKLIADAAKRCGSDGVPLGMRRYIREITHQPKTNWHQILADFIRFDRKDYTYARPDRRFADADFILPSFTDCLMGSCDGLWFLVDASGSVDDGALSDAFAEICQAVEQIDGLEGRLSFFDCAVSEPEPFSSTDDLRNIEPVGGGGTSFRVIFDYMKENMSDDLPRAIIIMTDGYAVFPAEEDACGVPVIWIITDSEVDPSWGEVIHIDTKD